VPAVAAAAERGACLPAGGARTGAFPRQEPGGAGTLRCYTRGAEKNRAGADGLDAYRAMLPLLSGVLCPDGHAVLEIGAAQGAAVTQLAQAAGLEKPRIFADLAGRPRCVVMGRA